MRLEARNPGSFHVHKQLTFPLAFICYLLGMCSRARPRARPSGTARHSSCLGESSDLEQHKRRSAPSLDYWWELRWGNQYLHSYAVLCQKRCVSAWRERPQGCCVDYQFTPEPESKGKRKILLRVKTPLPPGIFFFCFLTNPRLHSLYLSSV